MISMGAAFSFGSPNFARDAIRLADLLS